MVPVSSDEIVQEKEDTLVHQHYALVTFKKVWVAATRP